MEWLKTGVELFETLKKRVDGPYFVACAGVAALTLESIDSHRRPTDVLIQVADWLGLDTVAAWLRNAPPILAGQDDRVFWAATIVLCAAFVVQVCRPLFHARFDVDGVNRAAWHQSGTKLTATLWVVAAIGAQNGSFSRLVPFLTAVTWWAAVVVGIILGIGVIVYVFTRLLRLDPGVVSRPIWKFIARTVGSLLFSVFYALASLAWVLMYPLVVIVRWAFSLTHDDDNDSAELEERVPTGAVRLPAHAQAAFAARPA
ncbi:hypothetical protein [Microbacterium murale]|uniref:Uncharacterized protein n=1 Tax=Microbacterium murale TaxID=1081040 RepID=A0ABU0PC61_9MICO|nr:hypothetical protein [Microbacterium murale]MDQ0644497.1 hypothetical protein [Microbacterium murale]